MTSSRIALPFTIDWPNRSPSPVRDCAAALSVRFSLTGSTFSEIEVKVWNSVLISVVTPEALMTLLGPRCPREVMLPLSSFGVVSDTYLPSP